MHKFSKIAAIMLLGASVSLVQGADVKNIRVKRMDTNSTAGTAQLDMVSVTANRSETDVAKYTGQVSVLTQDNLSKTPSLIESMNEIPGIDTGRDFGRQAGQQFAIRGFGYQSEERVIIEQDGVKRSASLYSNMISTFRVDNDLLKRVEVVKGASSVLHGSGAIGGIVSMQTKSVDDFIIGDKNYGVMIGHRQESNHMNSNRAALAFKPVENLGFLIYGKHADHGNMKLADGGTENVKFVSGDERINTFFGKVEWDITDEHELDLSVFNYHEKLATGWQSLYRYDDSTIGKIKQRDYSAVYKFAPINNPWVNFSAQYYNTEASYDRTSGKVDYINTEKRWGINLKNESFFNTGSLEHRLVVGAEHEHRREDSAYLSSGVLRESNSHPNSYKDYGLYLQDIFNVGNFEFTIGGRYDRFERAVTKDNRPKYSESRFSPKIGLAYEVFSGINLLAGYAETFRGPTPHETSSQGPINVPYWYIPNPNLKPEIAKEYELGFSIDKENLFNDDKLYFKATYYNGKIKDMISLEPRPDLGNPPFDPDSPGRRYAKYDNIDEAKRSGFEIEAKYAISNFGFNLAYDHMKLKDNKTGKRIGAYTDKLVIGGNYLYSPWGLSTGVSMRYYFAPKRDEKSLLARGVTYEYVDSSFTIIDFKGSWVPKNFENKIFGEGFKVNFGVNNIFNKKYINHSQTKTTTMVGKGRNFYIDFEKKF
ncbi:TonB-dependent receptor domain-containing protein [Campylobacter sp. MOP51]|uniref:TonB-dependent receptor domain-containing protein n=1 Tax=Campylobacter canis TaxID=3378588 RepID=UPI003C48AD84